MGRNGKGWGVDDLWKERGEGSGRRWRIRLWDPHARRQTRQHRDGTYEEASTYAAAEAAKLRLGRTSLAGVDFLAVSRDLGKELRETGRVETHVAELERIAQEAAEAGATNMRAPDFAQKVRAYLSTAISRRSKAGGPLRPSTRNRYLTHLRAVSNYAVEAGLIDHSPLGALKRHTEPKPAKATFTTSELRTLVAERDHAWWLPFCLLTYTGCRIGEALHLRWEWIDWDARRVHVRIHPDYRLKRQKERSFPLQPELAAILGQAGRKRDLGWIVADAIRTADPKTAWSGYRRYLTACGIEPGKRSPHSSRHTYVALLLATGEDVFSVKRWVGHDTLTTTDGYSSAADGLRGAVESWPKGAFRLMAGAAASVG